MTDLYIIYGNNYYNSLIKIKTKIAEYKEDILSSGQTHSSQISFFINHDLQLQNIRRRLGFFKNGKGWGWCLMSLSTIFQLYRGGQFHWRMKPEYPEKTTDLKRTLDKKCCQGIFSDNLFSIPSLIWWT
jgi:hypothetical protein